MTSEEEQLFSATVRQGSTLWKQGRSGAWNGWDDSSATVSPVQNPEQISDERVTTALHTMQEYLQQTIVIAKRRWQNVSSKHTVSKTKDDAAYEAMEAFTTAGARQEDARCVYDQKCNEAAVAETSFTNAV